MTKESKPNTKETTREENKGRRNKEELLESE